MATKRSSPRTACRNGHPDFYRYQRWQYDPRRAGGSYYKVWVCDMCIRETEHRKYMRRKARKNGSII